MHFEFDSRPAAGAERARGSGPLGESAAGLVRGLAAERQWGEQNRPFSTPAGILANNVISDPASCSLWFYADQALWTPQITPDVSAAALVRRSLDWWLDQRTRPTGEVVCYWDYGNFLDANAGPLIAAWDYVEATGDRRWLARRIERLGVRCRVPGQAGHRRRRDGRGDAKRQPGHAEGAESLLRLVRRRQLRPQGRLHQRPHLSGVALPGRVGRATRPPRKAGPLPWAGGSPEGRLH